jgi:hypothetical protein
VKLARLLRTIAKAVRTDARTPLPLVPVPAETTAPDLERLHVGRSH